MSRRLALGLLAALLALTLGVATAVAAGPQAAPGSNTANGVETQTEAGPQVFTPSSTPCTDTVVSNAQFDSYDHPYLGTYDPSACPGPWSKVVMTLTGNVDVDQYDRLVDVEIGHAIFLHGSTSEPDGAIFNTNAAIQWSVKRDVTQYSSLLTQSQPVEVELDNVIDPTIGVTGVYGVSVTLRFYPATGADPAPVEPNVILPVSQAGDEPMFNLNNCPAANEQQGVAVTFPRNLDRLEAELFASGGGTEEEFWWLDPGNSDVPTDSPYREVDVYIDGALAGAATVSPSTFTGFNGPDFWEPIPSPRAWDLVPYDVDLTPFIGELSDGQPHAVTLGVANASYADDETITNGAVTAGCNADYWKVAANLEGYTDPTASVTGGTVSTETNTTAPAEDVTTDPTGQGLLYSDTVAHNLTYAGTVDTGAGAETVTVNDAMSENAFELPVSEEFSYGWDEASTTTTPAGAVQVSDDDHTYGADAQTAAGDYIFDDDDAQSDQTGTTTTFTSTTAETMQTQDLLGEAGALAAGTQADVEDECWQYNDSTGLSYEQDITAAAGQVLTDSLTQGCSTLPSLSSLPNPFATTTTATTTTATGTTTGTGTTTTGAGTTTTHAGTTTTGAGTTPDTGTTDTGSTTTNTATTPSDTDTTTTAGTETTPQSVVVTIPGTNTTITEPLESAPVVGLGTQTRAKATCYAHEVLRFAQHPATPVRETRAVAYVDNRRVLILRGTRITSVPVNRSGARSFTVKLVTTLSDGEVVSHVYSYSGCRQAATRTTVTVLRPPHRG